MTTAYGWKVGACGGDPGVRTLRCRQIQMGRKTPEEDSMSVAAASMTRAIDTIRARDAIITGLLVVGALFLLYAMFLDQGGLLAPFFGAASFSNNYLHEFAHDARHLLALPCH